MQMAAAAVGKQLVPWRRAFQELSKAGDDHRACVRILEESVGCYYVPPAPTRHVRRPSIVPPPQKIRLCSATIIIVPQNLLSQWHHEIAHHFLPDTFQVLSLDSKEPTPMPKGMCLFRICIISIPVPVVCSLALSIHPLVNFWSVLVWSLRKLGILRKLITNQKRAHFCSVLGYKRGLRKAFFALVASFR